MFKKGLILFTAILGIVFMASSQAFAIPLLQLYIEGGMYDATSETWVSTSPSAKLWVLGNIDGPGGKGPLTGLTLLAAFASAESGSIGFTPTTTGLIADPSTPTAPVYLASGTDTVPYSIPTHGIYGTGTSWKAFSLGNMSLTDSPVDDIMTSFPSPYPVTANGQLNAYSLAITGFTRIHFDVFGFESGKYVDAPFSHDAENTPRTPGDQIPEPLTLLLLGGGLAGMVGMRRFSRKS